ncbi:MAG: folate-binding protein, partial [Pseudomonadota bacterium]|nr:folate-binding protein [Pseudomonadota bacterium]
VRIAAGVPQGPVDLQPERALMLEAGLDRLGAVDFEKGCYVGQEVTARTHYRGLVKRRIVPLEVSGGCPASGEAVSEGERDLGTVLSVAGGGGERALCLAAMKLSDIHRINDGDHELTAGGHAARLAIPDWMLPLPDPSKTDTG